MHYLGQSLIVSLVLGITSVLGVDLSCPYACETALESFAFNDTDPSADWYVRHCTSFWPTLSFFLCMQQRCDANEQQAGWKEYNKYCVEDGLELLPVSILDNLTSANIKTLPVVSLADYRSAVAGTFEPASFPGPVVVGSDLFYTSYKTTYTFERSEIIRANYSYAMLGFWGIVILAGLLHRVLQHIIASRQRATIALQPKYLTGSQKLKRFMKAYITAPALFKHHAAEAVGWCTIPNRIQTLTIVAFTVINIVLNCVSFDVFSGNLYWDTKEAQIWRYISDRTACISLANLPLVFMFGIRNNLFLWVTGWSFSTYNQFHRWIARIATIEAIVHSIAWTVPEIQAGSFSADWKERYWYMGGVATVIMSLMLGFAVLPIRRKLYQVFLIAHIVMAIVFLIGMWYHLEIWDGEYNPYMYACFAIWGFDRLVRLIRLVLLNFKSRSAIATYESSSDIIKLTVPSSSLEFLKPEPGTYYYVYVMTGWKFWESHPFTMSSWDTENGARNLSFYIRPYNSFTGRLRNRITARQNSESGTVSSCNIRVAVEGPYGVRTNLYHYDNLLFIIGGSGITVFLAELCGLQYLPSAAHPKRPKHIHLVWAVRDISLFEYIYEHELRSWMVRLQETHSDLTLKVDVYITRTTKRKLSQTLVDSKEIQEMTHNFTATDHPSFENPSNRKPSLTVDIKAVEPSTTTSSKDKETGIWATSDGLSSPSSSPRSSSLTPVDGKISRNTANLTVSFFHARPDIPLIVAERVPAQWVNQPTATPTTQTSTIPGKLALVSCGPAGMEDDARASAVQAIKDGYVEVDYINEAFGW